MVVVDLLRAEPWLFSLSVGLLGVIVGSFLNVVVYRLPIMLDRQWRAQCNQLLGTGHDAAQREERFDLVLPASHCPHCGHVITAWENIPLLSYLMLRGRCSQCGAPISLRYPAVELVSGIAAAVVGWRFGFGWTAAAALLLSWGLIALSVIDLQHQLLPDLITLPLLWIGLLLSLSNVFIEPSGSILGAMGGYLTLWSVYWAFKWATGKEGMGYGDFKLIAMLGAWLGWQALPLVLLLSSLVGAVVGVSLIAFAGRSRQLPIPFGPYLAGAGWLTMLWGQGWLDAYLSWSGIGAH